MTIPRTITTQAYRTGLAAFVIVTLLLSVAGWWYYRVEAEKLRQEKYHELAAIGELKVQQIQLWRSERQMDARRLARSALTRKAVTDFLLEPDDMEMRTVLRTDLQVEQVAGEDDDVLLLTRDGNLLLAARDNPEPTGRALQSAIASALTNQEPVFSDFYRGQTGKIYIDLAMAVRDDARKPQAVVVVRRDPKNYLYPLIQSWPTPSRTAETVLSQQEGPEVVFVNQLRHATNAALSLRFPLTRTNLPAVQAALGKQGIVEGEDYRHVPVLTDIRAISNSPWVMIAKMDKAEVMVDAKYRAVEITLIIGLFIGLGVVAGLHHKRVIRLFENLYAADQQKLAAKEMFRTTLYSIGDGVITTDAAGIVREMNLMAEKLTGWTEAEARGKPLVEIFHIINETTRKKVANPMEVVLREKKVAGLANHTVLIARDGTEYPIADSAAPIRGENGKVTGVVLVFSDQTNKHAAQRALQASEEQFRVTFEQAAIGMSRTGLDGRLLRVNQRMCDIVGYPRDELLQKTFQDITHPDDLSTDLALMRQLLTGEIQTYTLEKRYLRKDGAAVPINLTVALVREAGGAPSYFIAAVEDITARKRAETALLASEARLNFALQTSRIGAWELDLVNHTANRTLLHDQIFGYPTLLPQWTYEQFLEHVLPEERPDVDRRFREATAAQSEWNFECRIRRADGEMRWIWAAGGHERNSDGKPLRMAGIVQDITARKQAEQIQTARLRLNDFALTHSHEELLQQTLDEAELLTGSQIGFFHFVEPDGKTLALQMWSTNTQKNMCRAEGKGSHYSVDKAGVWADALRQGRPVIHNDYANEPLRKGLPAGHAPVIRELVVPILRGNRVVAILGVGNKPKDYVPEDTESLTRLADLAWDIAEHKRAEEKSRESARFAQSTIDSLTANICVLDETGRIMATNLAWQQFAQANILGDAPTHIGVNYLDLCDAVTGPEAGAATAFAKGIRSVMHGEQVEFGLEYPCHSPTEQRWFLGRVTRFQGAGPLRVVVAHLNITERKQAELERLASEERLRLATEASAVGVWEWNVITNQIRWDAQMFRIYGVAPTADGIIDYRVWSSAVLPEDLPRQEEILQDTVRRLGRSRRRFRIRRADDGECRHIQAIETVRTNAQGQAEWVVGTNLDITERKQAEDALRLHKNMLEETGTIAKVGGWSFDAITGAGFWTDEVARIHDLDPAQPISKDIGLKYYVSESRAKIEAAVKSAIEQAIPYDLELEIVSAKGIRKWVHTIGYPVTENGRVVRVHGSLQDISAFKQMQAELEQSETRFRQMADCIEDVLYGVDGQTRELNYISPAFERMLGYTLDDVTRMGGREKFLAAVIQREKFEDQRSAFKKVQASPTTAANRSQAWWRCKDGSLKFIEDSWISVLSEGHLQSTFGVLRDMTQHKQAEAQTRLQFSALTAVANAIVITDRNGVIEWANPSFTKLTGFTIEESISSNPRILNSGQQSPAFYANLWATISTGNVWHGELINKRKDGRLFTADLTITPVRGADGQIAHFVAIQQDVTERRLLESRLRQAQKMEAVGTLAGGIAHDFNNILAAMFGFGHLLQQDTEGNSAAQEDIAEILKAANRAKELVQQILTFSRQHEQKREVIRLDTIVKEAAKFLRASLPAHIKIEMNLAANAPAVLADPTQIYQVAINLATNALHAMEGRPGQLTINLDAFLPDESFIRSHPEFKPGPCTRLTVADTGHGMDATTLERIFEPFFTTKPVGKGTGLGLSVVHGIVQSHEGIIAIESQPGRGTTFCLYFPAQTTAAVLTDAAAGKIPHGHGQNILVVDDEPALTVVLKRLLERLNYQVTTSNSAQAAIGLFRENPRRFDLVITDLTMPDINGLELALQLHALQPEVPVLLASGFSSALTSENLREAGIREQLVKPLSLTALAEALQRTLAQA